MSRLAAEARKCHNQMQDDAGWNMMVHYPMLREALCSEPRQVSQSKTVDFSLCLRPEYDMFPDSPIDAIRRLRQTLSSNAINHTDFAPLRNHPMAVSVETKRARTSAVGTWHAA
ncbi:hypothetical protein QQZ08_003702 [Neonectria magnoliae]|uniref:PD-(D/E)XK nuclease-like domain-containing protein n=1 Tax=Neonectria magnoliae TaxID=2732573 RepID=A0ABR1IAQ3_9HYPO